MSTYTSIADFIANHGGESFYYAGRCIYKYGFGAWVTAELKDGTSIYYESERACQDDWHKDCVGITCGSIIEGADYDAEPFYLAFPFTEEEWDRNYKNLESEVSYEWERNNNTTIRVDGPRGPFYAQWVDWDDKPRYCGSRIPKVVMAGFETLHNMESYGYDTPYPVAGHPRYTVTAIQAE